MNTKLVAIHDGNTTNQKVLNVPAEWDDRTTVSKMLEAFYAFSETKTGRSIIGKSYYGEDLEEYVELISTGNFKNPLETGNGWNILLYLMPDSFFESVGIQVLKESNENRDVHLIELEEDEEDAPLDTGRLNIVKTIGNYHIIKQFMLGTPDYPQTDEEFYHQWHFEADYGDLEENGFMGYQVAVVDYTQPHEYPDLEESHLFCSVEDVEEFIRSVQ